MSSERYEDQSQASEPTLHSTTPNAELMRQATVYLTDNWVSGISLSVIGLAVGVLTKVIPQIGDIVNILITWIFSFGWASWGLRIVRKQNAKFEHFFDGFKRLDICLLTGLLQYLGFLFPLLLIGIPMGIWLGFNQDGLVAFISEIGDAFLIPLLALIPLIFYLFLMFSQVWFFANDYQGTGVKVMEDSRILMRGYKFKFLRLLLRYFIWCLVGLIPTIFLLTFLGGSINSAVIALIPIGIVGVFLAPHFNISLALFYQDILGDSRAAKPQILEESLLDQDI
jgi:uncharacterized membrane protein